MIINLVSFRINLNYRSYLVGCCFYIGLNRVDFYFLICYFRNKYSFMFFGCLFRVCIISGLEMISLFILKLFCK